MDLVLPESGFLLLKYAFWFLCQVPICNHLNSFVLCVVYKARLFCIYLHTFDRIQNIYSSYLTD